MRQGMDPAALAALRSFGGNPMDQLVGVSLRRAAPPAARTDDEEQIEADDVYLEQLDEAPEDMLSPMERVEVGERRRLPEGMDPKYAPMPPDMGGPIAQLAPNRSPLQRIRPDIAPPQPPPPPQPYPDAGASYTEEERRRLEEMRRRGLR